MKGHEGPRETLGDHEALGSHGAPWEAPRSHRSARYATRASIGSQEEAERAEGEVPQCQGVLSFI